MKKTHVNKPLTLIKKRGITLTVILLTWWLPALAQVDAEQVLAIGRNVLSMDDYMLSIQYFNQAIKAKPYLADPYFFRALAKLELEDYKGAEEDCTAAIERNKFKTESYKLRGFARQYLGRNREAIDDYDVGLRHNPSDKYFLYYKSVAQTELKDYSGADSTFAVLLRHYPRFDEGLGARARLNALRGDTAAAIADLDKAIEASPSSLQPYLLRAEIKSGLKKWEEALADMDKAVNLRPKEADFYVNRAFIRYNLDDFFGAMSDYNYTLELEPHNEGALFNRGLLRYEVKDLDRAAADFKEVLRMSPDNFHAPYNMGLVELERSKPKEALGYFRRIADRYPRFYPVYYAQAEALRDMGDMRAAMQNVRTADKLVKRYVKNPEKNPLDRPAVQAGRANSSGDGSPENEMSDTEVMDRFNQLVTVGSASRTSLSYNEKIKGRVQDRDIAVEPEPSYSFSFLAGTASLKSTSNYFHELDNFNQREYIRQRVWLMPGESFSGGAESMEKIFGVADYYEQAVARPDARPADFFALGVARTMLKDYEAAVKAFNRALETTPDFTMALMGRAFARSRIPENRLAALVAADYDSALRLNPRLIYAWFNKGNLAYGAEDYTSALSCYSNAIEIDPSFGEAYYNRGLTYLRMGNRRQAFADLSKAGELGVVPSYNLLKRMK